MQIKIFQNIIDIIRNKSFCEYLDLRDTVLFFSQYNVLDKEIVNRYKKIPHSFYQRFFFNKEKNLIKKELSKIDRKSILPIKNRLRKTQLDLLDFAIELLNIIYQEGIKPILVGGSLIGAAINGYFVPWDDDIDFDLMYEDFLKLINFCQKNFLYFDSSKYTCNQEEYANLDIMLKNNPHKILYTINSWALCIYKGSSLDDVKTVDFFPRYYISENISKEQYFKYQKNKINEYNSLTSIIQELNFNKNEISNSNYFVTNSSLTAYGWGNISFLRNPPKLSYMNIQDLFPLVEIDFENFKFFTYKNYELYLSDFYGDYKKIPIDIQITKYKKFYKQFLE